MGQPVLYLVRYLATSPEAAIGETFGQLARWSSKMFAYPSLPGSEKRLGTYQLDETANPLLDLDDADELSRRHIRPTHVVIRPATDTADRGGHLQPAAFGRDPVVVVPEAPVDGCRSLGDRELDRRERGRDTGAPRPRRRRSRPCQGPGRDLGGVPSGPGDPCVAI